MWQKVRSIWRYVHEHFAEDFDFFTMHGDDVYYAVENLRQFLLSPRWASSRATVQRTLTAVPASSACSRRSAPASLCSWAAAWHTR